MKKQHCNIEEDTDFGKNILRTPQTQSTFTCLKLTIETLEQVVK